MFQTDTDRQPQYLPILLQAGREIRAPSHWAG